MSEEEIVKMVSELMKTYAENTKGEKFEDLVKKAYNLTEEEKKHLIKKRKDDIINEQIKEKLENIRFK